MSVDSILQDDREWAHKMMLNVQHPPGPGIRLEYIPGMGDNADAVAKFCKGRAHRIYNGETDFNEVYVTFGKEQTVAPNQWVMFNAVANEFVVYDVEQVDSIYSVTEVPANPKPVCNFCLADPRQTPLADGGEKACPHCGCRYNGEARFEEFKALQSVGLVCKA